MLSLIKIDESLSGIYTDFEQAILDAAKREKFYDVISELENIYDILENIKLEYSSAP